MIDRNKLSSKMLEEYETFEPIYSKTIANSVMLYMLGVIPLILTSAIATSKIIDVSIKRKKFKDESKKGK